MVHSDSPDEPVDETFRQQCSTRTPGRRRSRSERTLDWPVGHPFERLSVFGDPDQSSCITAHALRGTPNGLVVTAADLLRAISPFAICPTPDRGVPGVGRIAMHGIVNRSASPAAGGFQSEPRHIPLPDRSRRDPVAAVRPCMQLPLVWCPPPRGGALVPQDPWS